MKFFISNTYFLNKVGTYGSFLCVLHCVTSTFLPGILALLGINLLLNSSLEWALTIFSILIAGSAFWDAWKNHGSKKIALLFFLGTMGLFSSRLLEDEHSHHHAAAQTHDQTANILYAKNWSEDDLVSLLGIISGLAILCAHRKSMALAIRCPEKSKE